MALRRYLSTASRHRPSYHPETFHLFREKTNKARVRKVRCTTNPGKEDLPALPRGERAASYPSNLHACTGKNWQLSLRLTSQSRHSGVTMFERFAQRCQAPQQPPCRRSAVEEAGFHRNRRGIGVGPYGHGAFSEAASARLTVGRLACSVPAVSQACRHAYKPARIHARRTGVTAGSGTR